MNLAMVKQKGSLILQKKWKIQLLSRRLEVSRFQLILQVGIFCIVIGALVAGEILKLARHQALRIAPNLYHPLAFSNVVEKGIVSGLCARLFKVYETFEVLIRLGTCKALVHIFLSQRVTTKIPGVTDLGLVPRHVKKVAILGVGLMGSEIATMFLLSNYYMILKEVNEVLEAGIDRIKANLQHRSNEGKLSQEKFVKALSLLKGTFDYETFRDVDMVIEGWYRFIHDLISRGGPFLEIACISIAGLTILLWPVVNGSVIMAIFSSFFIGLYGAVIIYQDIELETVNLSIMMGNMLSGSEGSAEIS
ncbi:hypothetical protein FXO38_22228 [Capsicum annuum]|uniref:3-hydroxyacyl-CoA dehydrogenase NAD binding domain-containing protein n=1 Tax=Capsicum annuum TaxID=4072 RepID=A0A2G2Y825_CAPAN|nr:hypothetical protein FXO38_22228 [Capsicum annuum]KAF3657000.1 hypothetical protein FXO37_15169 [Capsicum annuum]PHT65915.1 hypothetical protein T459_30340 [Capsicum annuum]